MKDLILYDWVYSALEEKYIQLTNEDDLYSILKGYDDGIEPISLTTEILEKNGWFEIWKGAWEGDIALAKEKDSFRIKNTNTCLRYVHELQHSLHLSKRSELAKNFKI